MKNVTHSRGSFHTSDDIARALVELDRAFRSADTVARVEIPVPGQLSETLWLHVTVGDRIPILITNDEGRAQPPRVVVPPGFVRNGPIELQSVVDEQSFPFGHDWL